MTSSGHAHLERLACRQWACNGRRGRFCGTGPHFCAIGQGNELQLIPTVKMETRHPIEGPFGSKLSSIYNRCGVMGAWSRKSLIFFAKISGFGKTTRCGKMFEILFQKNSPPHRSTCCVQISWNLADVKSVKSCVAYLTKTNKKSPGSPAVAASRIALKIRQDQSRTMHSECSRFHPNRFTFGGVIAESVNTVKTRCKVNPIFG